MSPRWSQADDDELRRLAGTMTADEIGELLGRSRSAVFERAARLRISFLPVDHLPEIAESIRNGTIERPAWARPDLYLVIR